MYGARAEKKILEAEHRKGAAMEEADLTGAPRRRGDGGQ